MTEMWDLTDEQLSKCITKCHEGFMKSKDADEASRWKSVMDTFMTEQRMRMDMMLKDETDANKLNLECKKHNDDVEKQKAEMEFNSRKHEDEIEMQKERFEYEKKSQKLNTGLKIGEMLLGAGTIFATIFSAVTNLKAKKIEMETKSEAWNRICKTEEEGEIPLTQSNKFIKW